LRPAVEGVGALAGLDLDKLVKGLASFRLNETGESLALRLDSQAGPALLRRRDPNVRYHLPHQPAPQLCANR
jgi:hypothetical protein